MNGKGDKSRITDYNKFCHNYDNISWNAIRKNIQGRQISYEEAIKGLGDPTKWKEEGEKIRQEFIKQRKCLCCGGKIYDGPPNLGGEFCENFNPRFPNEGKCGYSTV